MKHWLDAHEIKGKFCYNSINELVLSRSQCFSFVLPSDQSLSYNSKPVVRIISLDKLWIISLPGLRLAYVALIVPLLVYTVG